MLNLPPAPSERRGTPRDPYQGPRLRYWKARSMGAIQHVHAAEIVFGPVLRFSELSSPEVTVILSRW
jgi:hypothetical protein